MTNRKGSLKARSDSPTSISVKAECSILQRKTGSYTLSMDLKEKDEDGFYDLTIQVLTYDGKPLRGLKLTNLTYLGTVPGLQIQY